MSENQGHPIVPFLLNQYLTILETEKATMLAQQEMLSDLKEAEKSLMELADLMEEYSNELDEERKRRVAAERKVKELQAQLDALQQKGENK